MLYAIIILSILVVILLLCIGVLLYGMKNNKKTLDGILGNDDVTEEEIISMVREGHEQGTILASEAELIHNVFEFDDKEVKDIMTHRKNIVSLDGSMSFIDAIEFIIDTGKSRFPVYENDVDSIIGVLHIKDAFTFFEKNEVYRSSIKDIDGLIRPVDFIPETVNINDLFKKMQSKKSHLAMVVDEYGQISGLIAMEDILEELVGNIEDEHDEEENYIRKNDDETFIMDGMTEFSDVKEALSLPVDDDAYETLNGFIISLSDKIPEEGDKTVISAYGYRFSVMSVEDKVIKQVMIKKLAPEEKNDIIRYRLFLKVEKRIQIMSGHSKFANIKHKKEKNDAAKGKIFTMIGRELAVAVKEGGPDPANNFKLAQVVAKAKANNMPNDTIERGIKKAAGDGNSVNYETATYEGYGPSGTAIIVKCLTDNKNRTAANVRNAFTKGQGSIGTQGCVSYMFDEKGQIIIDKEECDMDADDLMMQALDAGAEDFADEEDSYEITTAPADFEAVRAALEEAGITMASAEVTMIPQTYVTLTDEADITNIGRILDLLDDDDDVQEVYHNWEE